MKFQTHNDKSIDTLSTCLRGHIQATRAQLELTFGKPVEYKNGETDGDITTYWDVEFENGIIAMIYDWRNGATPSEDEVISWHIGGHGFRSSGAVHDAFRDANNLNAKAA